jgi:putative membrane protein
LNIGGMALLYLTPLYNAMHSNTSIHFFVHLHFILAGYLFVWSIAGPDPAPKRPGLRLRFIVLFFSMAIHAYLSKFMYAHHFPRTAHHSPEEIESGAMFMYYGGDIAELLLAVAFFAVWYRTKGRRSALLVPIAS